MHDSGGKRVERGEGEDSMGDRVLHNERVDDIRTREEPVLDFVERVDRREMELGEIVIQHPVDLLHILLVHLPVP